MGPFTNQHFTVFGGAYVQERHEHPRHDGFRLPASSEPGSLAPWGAVLCALLVAATAIALKTTTAAVSGVTVLASLQ